MLNLTIKFKAIHTGVCDVAQCLMKQYHALVPLGGVRWSANQMVRQLGRGFFGVGCPHPAIECLASQTTKMLTHYGCEMAVGCLLQSSVTLLILELGMGSQPFTVDFLKCDTWVTESWVKKLVGEGVYLWHYVGGRLPEDLPT